MNAIRPMQRAAIAVHTDTIRNEFSRPVRPLARGLAGAMRGDAPTVRSSSMAAAGLCAVIAALVELPRFATVDRGWWQERFLVLIAFAGLVAFVLHVRRASARTCWSAAACVAACAALVGVLPELVVEDPLAASAMSDSLLVVLWSVPLMLIGLAGVGYAGDRWRHASAWAEFARVGSGWAVIAGLLLSGELVLGLATYGLLVTMLQLYGVESYLGSALAIGVCVTPVVAACVQAEMGERLAPLAALLARIFAPLALLVVVVGLVGTGVQVVRGTEGVELLDVTHGLPLVALVAGVFAMAVHRDDDGIGAAGLVPIALMVTTVPLAGMALAALLPRMMAFGATATGVAAVGMDVAILVHAGVTLSAALRACGGLASVRAASLGYLPVYFLGAVVTASLVPLVFGGW